jgi:hypothetical protein
MDRTERNGDEHNNKIRIEKRKRADSSHEKLNVIFVLFLLSFLFIKLSNYGRKEKRISRITAVLVEF